MIRKVYGLAGSGKTHYMAEQLVSQNIKNGVHFTDMISISYTREARDSFKKRCAKIWQQPQYNYGRPKSFHEANVMTLHSFCAKYFIKKDKSDKSKRMYYNIDQFTPEGVSPDGVDRARRLLHKMRMFSYNKELFNKIVEESRLEDADIMDVYMDYLDKKGDKFDYQDTLLLAESSDRLKEHWKFSTLDEAQDFTPLHWEIIKKHLIPNSELMLIGGDPTQAIMQWMGADPSYFIDGIDGSDSVALATSLRIPKGIVPLINSVQRTMTDGSEVHQILSNKEGGIVRYEAWQEVIHELIGRSDTRQEALILSLNSYNLRRIGDDLIEAGVLFAQATNHEFTPWSPTVTLSDHAAYSLYYLILNRSFDTEIQYSMVRKMVSNSSYLSERWAMTADTIDDPDWAGSKEFNISIGTLVRYLDIPEDIGAYDLMNLLFEWPPKFKPMLRIKKEEPPELGITWAHFRIMRYMENCGQGPYVSPLIRLSTVHSAKGGESEYVVIIMARDRLRGSDERKKLYINAISRSSKEVIFTILPEDIEHVEKDHFLNAGNLHECMSAEEWSRFAEVVKW